MQIGAGRNHPPRGVIDLCGIGGVYKKIQTKTGIGVRLGFSGVREECRAPRRELRQSQRRR
jgi:hypothetical protein